MTLMRSPYEAAASSMREDDHFIEFQNTRTFAAQKWQTSVEAQEISASDWERSRKVSSCVELSNWIYQSMEDSKAPQQKTHLQTLLLLSQPVYGFTTTFEKLVAPQKVEMSIVWGLLFMNISQALSQNEKLKRMTSWLGSLRRAIESLNQCLETCTDQNNARTQTTDIFIPLLNLLTGLLKYQRSYTQEREFVNNHSRIQDFVDNNIREIESVLYHFRITSQHTKEQQEINASGHSYRGLPFRTQKNPYDRAAFPVDNIPDIRTDQFYGRESCIENINHHLGCDASDLRTYLIYGQRGIGKTQIALEYANRYRSKYDAILWIRCETSAALRQSFSDAAVVLELSTPDQKVHFEENQIKVLEWLSKTSKKWLLIYDNAERAQGLNAYWPRDAIGSILITSRSYHNFEHHEKRYGETVEVFNPEERWELLMQLLGTDWQYDHLGGKAGRLERDAADVLLKHLDGLALGIMQAATLILDVKIGGDQSIVTLLSLFEATRETLPPRFSGARGPRIHALDTIWAIALNNLTKHARSLLGVFSLLAPDSIPLDLFLPSDQTRLNGLLEFAKQEDCSQCSALEMSCRMRKAIQELKEAKLIQQVDRTFVIHRVIQEAMNYNDIGHLQDSFNATSEILNEAFPKLSNQSLLRYQATCQRYVQHVVQLTKSFSEYQAGRDGCVNASASFIELLRNCGWYLYECTDYTECIQMTNVARSATDDKDGLMYASLCSTLGSTYFELNKLKQARKVFTEAKSIRAHHLPKDDPSLAAIIANLGNIDSAEGNLDEAEELFEHTRRVREGLGDSSIVLLGQTFLQLGRVYYLRKDTFLANKLYDKAEACFSRKPDHAKHLIAHLHFARGNLAFDRSALDQATQQFTKCKELCYAVYPVHPLTSASFYKLALCDISRGRGFHDKALLNLEKAFNIAHLRSGGEINGTVARIQWKRAEIMIENPIQREEGLSLRSVLKIAMDKIAIELGLLSLQSGTGADDEWINMLVPGYFR